MTFDDQISQLCSAEMAKEKASKDADRVGAMIERLARALGFTIAIAANGNKAAIDDMMIGVEGYIHQEAVEKSKVTRFIEGKTS